MTEKEELKKLQDFLFEEYNHHAHRDIYNQECVSYNWTELFSLAKSIRELLKEEPVSKDLNKEYHNFLKREWFDKPGKTISEMMRLTAEYFANWQRNSVWHNSNDKPKNTNPIIVEDEGIFIMSGVYREKDNMVVNSINDIPLCNNIRWAYIEDLLPSK